jgi:hypothetical protein
MSGERDPYGKLINPAEAQEEVMFRLFDLMDDAELAGFSPDLIVRLNEVRLLFLDQFEAKYPGFGKGRSVWR